MKSILSLDKVSLDEGKKYTEEILCGRSKQAIPYGAGYTDEVEMISEDLASVVYNRALRYGIECDISEIEGNENIAEKEGQCGFLRCTSDVLVSDSSPGAVDGVSRYKVFPVTAKHNMSANLGRELFGTKVFSPVLNSCKRVTFPDKGCKKLETPLVYKGSGIDDDDKVLPYGLDFTFGVAIEDPRNDFTSKTTSFRVVPHDFKIEKGQKIGICVWRSKDRISDEVEGTTGKLSEEEEKKFYGPARVPVILTGEVKAVYGDRRQVFAHNINTYAGCSGAIIFLLDKDQPPESVQDIDWGLAIGVQAAGYTHHNLGMSVIEAFHRRTGVDFECVS